MIDIPLLSFFFANDGLKNIMCLVWFIFIKFKTHFIGAFLYFIHHLLSTFLLLLNLMLRKRKQDRLVYCSISSHSLSSISKGFIAILSKFWMFWNIYTYIYIFLKILLTFKCLQLKFWQVSNYCCRNDNR